MMRKVAIVAAILAITATVASAKPITKLDSAWGSSFISQGFAMSADGTYIAGSGQGNPTNATNNYPNYWQVDSTGAVIASGAFTTKGGGQYVGIDQAGGTQFVSGNIGGNGGATEVIGRASNNLTSASILLPSSDVTVGGKGSCAAFMNAGTPDAWIVGYHTKAPNEAMVWLWSAGLSTVRNPSDTTPTNFIAVASNGTAVGNNKSGPVAAKDNAVYSRVTDGNTVLGIPLFTGAPASLRQSLAYGISPDGSKIALYQLPTGFTLTPCVFDVTTNTTTALAFTGGDIPGTATQGAAYDVTNSGIALGSIYGGTGVGEIATIWDPANGMTPMSLVSVLTDAGYDLTGWTGFGNKTVTQITDLSGGRYAVAGTLLYNGTSTAFYAIVPEPATLSFLALGGLALIRRRR